MNGSLVTFAQNDNETSDQLATLGITFNIDEKQTHYGKCYNGKHWNKNGREKRSGVVTKHILIFLNEMVNQYGSYCDRMTQLSNYQDS